jgi:hypothetical protein
MMYDRPGAYGLTWYNRRERLRAGGDIRNSDGVKETIGNRVTQQSLQHKQLFFAKSFSFLSKYGYVAGLFIILTPKF